MFNPINVVKDAWFAFATSLDYETSMYTKTHQTRRNTIFEDWLTRQKNRRDRLATWLKVILSAPKDQSEITTMFHLAATTMTGVSDEHLPVLLWYRDIISRQKEYSDLRRYLLESMIALMRRNLWPTEVNTTDPNDLVRQWRALLDQQKPR